LKGDTIQESFVFGGDGCGELLAFDLWQSGICSVVCFSPIAPEGCIKQIAPSFEQSIAMVDVQNAYHGA